MKTSHFISSLCLFGIVLLSTAFAPFQVESDKKNSEFKTFLSHFDSADLPYNITFSDIKHYIENGQSTANQIYTKESAKAEDLFYENQKKQSDAINQSTFLPEAFRGFISRMGPPIFEPLAQFELNNNMIGIVYTSSTRFENYYRNYKILIYNQQGEVLNVDSINKESKVRMKRSSRSGAFLAGYAGINKSMTFKIDEQGHIWQNVYEHKWSNHLRDCSLEENVLTDAKLVETKVFKITKNGTIKEMKEYPTVAKASLN